jgi:hypothetical protein
MTSDATFSVQILTSRCVPTGVPVPGMSTCLVSRWFSQSLHLAGSTHQSSLNFCGPSHGYQHDA